MLDLFCGAGGAARGYADAFEDAGLEYEIVGVDNRPQPRYPFAFVQADAMTYPLDGFDAIHASPPCQAFTALRTAWNAKPHDDLVTPTIQRLFKAQYQFGSRGVLWIVENVPGAPLHPDFALCGTMFGLGIEKAELRRHRWFQTNWPGPLLRTPCAHKEKPITIGVYGQHRRDRRRNVQTFFSVEDGKEAMGIDWMTGDELSQAIPPAYTRYIGKELLGAMEEQSMSKRDGA